MRGVKEIPLQYSGNTFDLTNVITSLAEDFDLDYSIEGEGVNRKYWLIDKNDENNKFYFKTEAYFQGSISINIYDSQEGGCLQNLSVYYTGSSFYYAIGIDKKSCLFSCGTSENAENISLRKGFSFFKKISDNKDTIFILDAYDSNHLRLNNVITGATIDTYKEVSANDAALLQPMYITTGGYITDSLYKIKMGYNGIGLIKIGTRYFIQGTNAVFAIEVE